MRLVDIITFLDNHSGTIIGLTTIAYALITSRMLYETKKLRVFQTEPHVFISIQSVQGASFLKNMVIQNIGAAPAYDIFFQVDPDIVIMHGKKLTDINFIQRGLKRLAPNEKIEFFVANTIKLSEEATQTEVRITVSYRGREKEKKAKEETFELGLTEKSGMFSVDTDPYKEMVTKLDAIHQDLKRVSTIIPGALRVVVYTKDELNKSIAGKAPIKDDVHGDGEKKVSEKAT